MRTALSLAALMFAGSAGAECRMALAGASCVTVPTIDAVPADIGGGIVQPGEILGRDGFTIVHTPWFYGLPPAEGAWVYARVEDDLYRLDIRTLEVLERMTLQMRRFWDDPVHVYAAPPPRERAPLPQIGVVSGS